MSTDGWDGSGYDAEVSSGSGLWFRLKEKGQKARLRLVSPCCRYTELFEDRETGQKKPLKKAAWVAIVKEVVNNKPQKHVVIFQGGPMVYGLIKTLADSDEWGDPTHYDIMVERTEKSGQYYTVQPLPKPAIGPISEADAQLVTDANIDWPNVCLTRNADGTGTVAHEVDDSDPFGDDE